MKRVIALAIAASAMAAMVSTKAHAAPTTPERANPARSGDPGPQRRGRIIIRPQTPNPPGPRGRYIDVEYPSPEQRATNLAELLNLSDEQKQKVQAIFVEQDKQALALWADESLAAEARTKKMAEVRAAASRKVRDLLTDEQRKKYDSLGTEEKPTQK